MQRAIIIHDFMLADKKLKGSKLLVYAFIYSFCQMPKTSYFVGWRTACKFLGISKSSYYEAILWLVREKYLTDDLITINPNPIVNFYDHDINSDKIQEMIKVCQTRWVK